MRCSFATWRGTIPNETPGGMISHRGLVLHIQQSSSEAGTDSWFHNPAAQASAHLGVAFDGSLDQWVDTDDKAWAEMAGNPNWVSVEIEGFSGTAATTAQVQTIARLYAWLVAVYKFPFQSTDDPINGWGLGWHGMGGAAWGGHDSCPGDPIKAQRPAILRLAQGQSPGPVPAPVSSTTAQRGDLIMLSTADPKLAIAVVSRPKGGEWTVFQDGAVHSNAGAIYYGSYPGLPVAERQGVPVFTDAKLREGVDGYVILRQDGATYHFGEDQFAAYTQSGGK